jgi:hypothetical protein
MSDEEGNGPCLQTPGRGSAFWCVRQRLQRNYTYPFRSTDLVSVSTTLPAAGEHRDLTLPAGLLTRNVSYAGLFGPGTYTWDNGKVTAASPEFTQRRSSRNTPSWSQSSPHLVLVLGTAAARDRILSETCLIRLGTTNGFVSLGGKNGGGGTEGTSYSFQIDCSYEENSAGANLPPPGSQVEVQLITTPILTNTFVFPPSAVTR